VELSIPLIVVVAGSSCYVCTKPWESDSPCSQEPVHLGFEGVPNRPGILMVLTVGFPGVQAGNRAWSSPLHLQAQSDGIERSLPNLWGWLGAVTWARKQNEASVCWPHLECVKARHQERYLYCAHGDGGWTFRPLLNVKLDALTFNQVAEAFLPFDSGVMYKHILLAIITGKEAITLPTIEPLDGTTYTVTHLLISPFLQILLAFDAAFSLTQKQLYEFGNSIQSTYCQHRVRRIS